MSYLPAKLRNKLERRQKAKIQLQASFKSVELKEQIENEIRVSSNRTGQKK